MTEQPKLRVLDLFSGIGGFSLGLERTGGFETVAFCEIEPFPRRVLAKHWPEVPCYHDVRELTAARLAANGIAVDVICGGFPCQDISTAGKRAGLAGERSGLWSEIVRLVCELRPRFVIVENVSALLFRGMGEVLGDLAESGYDAEWRCIPAADLGAPHNRDRIWIVAYPAKMLGDGGDDHGVSSYQSSEAIFDIPELGNRNRYQVAECGWNGGEPNVGRVAHGVPGRVDRLAGLGNAVVPQIPELIGNAILQSRRIAA